MQKNPTDQADSFDQFLFAQLANSTEYLDDAGFSAGVMAQLAKPKAINPWVKAAILLVPMLVIALAVCSQFPWRALVHNAYALLLQMDLTHLLHLGLGLMAAVFAWLIYLFRREQLL